MLLDGFFKVVDPISVNRQGNDRGSQYRSGIYYVDEASKWLLSY
nr:peptide-methionine (S)-S-oxide reductase [Extibacter muris]